MIQQTKNAIEKLNNAGVPRKFYSVNTKRCYCGIHSETGKPMFEYGYAFIWFKVQNEKILPFAKSMAQAGLKVEISIFDTVTGIHVKDKYGDSGLYIHDYTNVNKNGLPKVTKKI